MWTKVCRLFTPAALLKVLTNWIAFNYPPCIYRTQAKTSLCYWTNTRHVCNDLNPLLFWFAIYWWNNSLLLNVWTFCVILYLSSTHAWRVVEIINKLNLLSIIYPCIYRTQAKTWLTTGWHAMLLALDTCDNIKVYGMVYDEYCK